jgi:CBS domain-containing protein
MDNLCVHRSAWQRSAWVRETHELVTIGPDQDVEEARRLTAEHKLDRIRVVQDDRLVSESDLRSDEGHLA